MPIVNKVCCLDLTDGTPSDPSGVSFSLDGLSGSLESLSDILTIVKTAHSLAIISITHNDVVLHGSDKITSVK